MIFCIRRKTLQPLQYVAGPLFLPNITQSSFNGVTEQITDSNGVFCDPQLGCSTRLIAQDLSDEHAWQLSQEFRLSSNFSGPLNFSVGGNYLHYETEENYYVFVNTISRALSYSTTSDIGPGPTGHNQCLFYDGGDYDASGYQHPDPRQGMGQPTHSCVYIDFNPLVPSSTVTATIIFSARIPTR